MVGLGKKLRRLRKEKDLAQDELGNLMKVHGRQISRYENDRSMPSGKVLQKYAKFFEISAEDLLQVDEELPETKIQEKDLYKLFQQMERLNEDEKNALKKIIQAVITKNQIQSFLLQQA